jgi:hypothetical protein
MTDINKIANQSDDQIVGIELKNVCYSATKSGDILCVKERLHYKDGSTGTRVVNIENYPRSFWVSKPGYRKYTQKKESECLSKLQHFSVPQYKLNGAIAKALGRPGMQGSLKMLCRSPYVYGADITTPAMLKQEYSEKNNGLFTPNSVAVLDIETDVVKGTGDIISVALTYKDRAIITATEEWLGTLTDVEADFYRTMEYNLGEICHKRGLGGRKVEVYIGKTPGDICKKILDRAHEWMPDFIAIWNIDFDLPRIISALEKEGYDINDVFSDPTVPKQYRKAKYIKGSTQKVTATGAVISKHPAECWHIMESTSSFYFIDAMSVYCLIRAAKGKEPSYALDAILKKHLGIRKLKFDAVKDLENTLQWHVVMQSKYKLEYMVYNLFDCISVEMLDEANGDLARSISGLNGISEYSKFSSQPRRTVDNLHFFYLNNKKRAFATTADVMDEELDVFVYSMKDWIFVH